MLPEETGLDPGIKAAFLPFLIGFTLLGLLLLRETHLGIKAAGILQIGVVAVLIRLDYQS